MYIVKSAQANWMAFGVPILVLPSHPCIYNIYIYMRIFVFFVIKRLSRDIKIWGNNLNIKIHIYEDYLIKTWTKIFCGNRCKGYFVF